MKRILITGATGNIGLEVVHYLRKISANSEILAAVRDIEKAKKIFKKHPLLHYRKFDFENNRTFPKAFDQVDILFLMRPPHISNVDEVFRPLLKAAKKYGINKVIFISVHGVEKSKVIPHNQIEQLVKTLQFDYIFVRPSYFMQNLTTTLLPEILKKRSITLPSGKAKFNWIDVRNVGEASVHLLEHFEKNQNKVFEITGSENKNFGEVVNLLTKITGQQIRFKSINPISFYFKKKKEGAKSGFALVVTILHFLPRLQAEPKTSDHYQKLTGKVPTTLAEFIEREKEKLKTPQ